MNWWPFKKKNNHPFHHFAFSRDNGRTDLYIDGSIFNGDKIYLDFYSNDPMLDHLITMKNKEAENNDIRT